MRGGESNGGMGEQWRGGEWWDGRAKEGGGSGVEGGDKIGFILRGG